MVRTTRFTTLIVFSIAVVLLLTGSLAQAGDPGESGMLSLRMGVGAREAGMGGAGVASSHGASAIFWNPANNVFVDFETELVLQHYRYLGLFNHEAAAVAHKMGSGVLGIMFTGLYSDEIDRYGEEAVGIPEGTFRPYDVSFGLSYAMPLGDRFGVGMAAKLVYEKIDIYSDTGFAFDFFVSHRSMIEGLTFAASATNFGGQMTLKDEPFDLPSAFRLGMAYNPENLFGNRLTLAGDVVIPNDTNEKAHLGAEFVLIPEVILRAGTRINYDTLGWTAGIGVRAGVLGIDYAYEDSDTDGFDDGHKFSLNLRWD